MPAARAILAQLLAVVVTVGVVSLGSVSAEASATGTTTTTLPVSGSTNLDSLVGRLQADLARLAAIGSYGPARQALAASQAAAAASGATAAQRVVAGQAAAIAAAALVTQAVTVEQATETELGAAKGSLAASRRRLSSLAVALYVRPYYGTETLADQNAGPGARSVMITLLMARAHDEIKAAQHRVAGDVGALKTVKRQVTEAASAAAAAATALAAAKIGQAQSAASARASVSRATLALAAIKQAAMAGTPLPAGQTSPPSPTRAGQQADAGPGPPILGPSALSATELTGWFATTGSQAAATVPIGTLAGYYIDGGRAEGVAGDIAFAQSVLETGYFSFPAGGQLTGTDNNFAGIGACDTCAHGMSFPDARTGVQAQLQLLHAYASTKPVPTPLVGSVGVSGCCQTWAALTGVWATSPTYGFGILDLYRKMVEWVLPLRAAATGL